MMAAQDFRPNTKAHLYPPGPKSARLVTLLLAHWANPLGFWTRLAQEYGDTVHFNLGGRHVFLLSHPEAVKDVLLTHEANFVRGSGYETAKRFMGSGLLTSVGSFHRGQRRLLQPGFHRTRLAAYGRTMTGFTDEMTKRWQEGATIDLSEEMRLLTSAIACKTLFGADPDGVGDELDKSLSQIARIVDASYLYALPLGGLIPYLPVPSNFRFRKALAQLDKTIYDLCQAHRSADSDRMDIISMLLDAGTPDDQIRDEVVTLLFAGHQSSARALTWTLYLLSQYPEVEERVHRELAAVVGERLPTAEDFPRLTYTQAVIAECLRLYPPAFRIDRQTSVDVSIRGAFLPRGSSVVILPYAIQRDPRFFADPLRFDPSRWLPETRNMHPDFAYIPFGAGIRRCLGEQFARMETVLLAATITQRWRLRSSTDRAVEAEGRFLLRPRPAMQMRLERRVKARLESSAQGESPTALPQ